MRVKLGQDPLSFKVMNFSELLHPDTINSNTFSAPNGRYDCSKRIIHLFQSRRDVMIVANTSSIFFNPEGMTVL